MVDSFQHGGNIFGASKKIGKTAYSLIDFSSNILPFKIPLSFSKKEVTKVISVLPEPYAESLKEKLSNVTGLNTSRILMTAGSTEAIQLIAQLYYGKSAVIVEPAYLEYEKFCLANKIDTDFFYLTEDDNFQLDYIQLDKYLKKKDLLFICNPVNPTGALFERDSLINLAKKNYNTLFIIDESYMPFVVNKESSTLLGCDIKNIIVLHSFSKIYAMPGLRLGFIYSFDESMIKALKAFQSCWSVNSVAQLFGDNLLDCNVSSYLIRLNELKDYLYAKLSAMPHLKIFESSANFFMFKSLAGGVSSIFDFLLKKGVLIRVLDNIRGLNECFGRISVRGKKDIDILLDLIKEFYGNL